MLLALLRPDDGDPERRRNVRARNVAVPHCMEHVIRCGHVWLDLLRDGNEIRALEQLILARFTN